MISLIITLLFYSIAGLIVFRRVPAAARLLTWGSLPIAWVSLLGISGLLQTLLGLSSLIPLLLLFAGMLYYLFRMQTVEKLPVSLPSPVLWILLLTVLAECGVSVLVHTRVPWGSWDPMFTWIMRARFLVDGGAMWTQGFSNDLALLHPDYPPLFSWALVPLWSLDGSSSSLAVAALTIPCFSGFTLILTGWWEALERKSSLWAAFTLAVILSTPFLIYLHAVKSLDFMLAYAILASLAWYHYAATHPQRLAWSCFGFVVAWSTLVKNEGQLWMLACLVSLILIKLSHAFLQPPDIEAPPESNASMLPSLLKGAAIPLVFLIWFKASLAPPNDLIEPQRAFEISQVIQPEVFMNPYGLLIRLDQVESPEWHQVIWSQLWNVLLDWKTEAILLWSIAVLFLVNFFWRQHRLPRLLVAVGFQLGGYYAVYLLTPYNPYWHVSTSMNRLLLHIAPAALCLLGFALCCTSNVSKSAAPRSQPKRLGILLSLSLLGPLFCLYQIQTNAFPWDFPQESMAEAGQLKELKFPRVSQATFITDQFEPATLYRMQFAALPTVLLVDRRAPVLIARFPTEQELKDYCAANDWELKAHQGGLGWAESANPQGPLPHMDRLREQIR
ncbi:hypothetical protein [Gimesia sp.]|uniref:hypothetical protein n=1 Tax=Gimesia sp. TaxID=2024833 RepID=UPI000C3C1F3F|nr:hypothetical protein [Gimesia sp.]MAX37427.1 hypothetical protein [Gimesia sp.]|tara:strand:+ start:1600 stop:3441 length:1842 start_codon:yes stop_codon:yes gene_type:complete